MTSTRIGHRPAEDRRGLGEDGTSRHFAGSCHSCQRDPHVTGSNRLHRHEGGLAGVKDGQDLA